MFDEEDLLVNETNEIDLKIQISRLRCVFHVIVTGDFTKA